MRKVMSVTYQTTRGSGQPLTVQCRRTHCFSHTVWERGLITNSGECIRLSTFIRLKCSSCSWIWKSETPKSKRTVQKMSSCVSSRIEGTMLKQRKAESIMSALGFAHAGVQISQTWVGAVHSNISAGALAWLFVHELSQSNTTSPVGSRSSVSKETQSPEESRTHWAYVAESTTVQGSL